MTAKRTALGVLVGLAGVLFCLQLLKPIRDPDFFWHLTTGSWILDNHSLPYSDPFAFTSTAVPTTAQRFTLTSYWLSQLLLAMAFRLGGMGAIFFLRFIPALLLVWALARRRKGDPFLFVAFLLLFMVILKAYTLERPQTWSFVCWALLLLLLPHRGEEEVPAFPAHRIVLVPLLMLCWANLHGGFLLGQATLVLALGLEAARFLRHTLRPLAPPAFGRFGAAAVLGLLVSLANPNTWHVVGYLRLSVADAGANMEYFSSLKLFQLLGDWRVVVFWALMALTAGGLLLRPRRTDLTELALLIGTGVSSLLQIRYIVFFCVVAVPVAARAWSGFPFARIIRAALLVAALAVAGAYAWGERSYLPQVAAGAWVDDTSYPRAAADFIATAGLTGAMYNVNEWGGYLMWRLWPGRQIFTDGRNLNPLAQQADGAINYSPLEVVYGLPVWKAVFDTYRINYAVFPWRREGRPAPFLGVILEDPQWVPVFLGGEATIFVRDIPANARVIAEHALSKEKLRRSIAEAAGNMR